MPTIIVPTAPPLSSLPGVELLATGEWDISTGRAYFTTGDLVSAVAAQDCPAVRRPVLKLGHTDPRFDGEPAVGWIANMAATSGGHVLVGDYTGMPGWLGTVLASAYPDRSIEGQYDYRCQIGHTHPFVITAVALLGVFAPGIGTLTSLQDVATLYGVGDLAAASTTEVTGSPVTITVRAAAAPVQTGAMVALVPTETDAERLAVEGGEPVDQLHLTLRYLGKAADITPDDQARIADAVRAVAANLAPIEGDGFAISLLNPTNADRETCIVLGVGGAGVDAVHDEVESAVDGLGLTDLPDPHAPFLAHVTLIYTDVVDQVAALVDRTGPLVFDRVRVAFAGVITDIPLTGTPVAAADGSHISSRKDSAVPNPNPREVAAGVTTDDVRRQYYDDADWSRWITEIQLDPLQLIVCDDNTGKTYRIPVTVAGDTIAFGGEVEVAITYVDKPATPVAAGAPRGLVVYASRAESRPGTAPKAGGEQPAPVVETSPAEPALPADQAPIPEAPATEPTTPPTTEEDTLSTIPSGVLSRLGLADDADEDAVNAALDALKAQVEAPPAADQIPATVPEPTPVAASGGTDAYAAELTRLSTELAAIKAREAAGVKASLFNDVLRAGKIAPADLKTWQDRYDEAPKVTAEILASFAPGTAVPIGPNGYASTDEPSMPDAGAITADEAALFAPVPVPSASKG